MFFQRPDWPKWEMSPVVELWQAVAMWCNIEPDSIRTDNNAFDFMLSLVHSAEFQARLQVARSHLFADPRLTPIREGRDSDTRSKIKLAGFVEWAQETGLDAPSRFTRLGSIKDQAIAVRAQTLPQITNEPIDLPMQQRADEEVATSEEDLKSKLWDLADEIAETVRVNGDYVSLNQVCKELEKEAVRKKKHIELLNGQKGPHKESWFKSEGRLKGWKDPRKRK